MLHAQFHQLPGVVAVTGTHEQLQVRELMAHHAHYACRGLGIIDRHQHDPGLLGTRRPQQFGAAGIGVEDARPELTHELDLGDIGVQRGEVDALALEHARADLAEAAEAGDHHLRRFLTEVLVIGALGFAGGAEVAGIAIEEGRGSHRQGHRTDHQAGEGLIEDAGGHAGGQQHEVELTTL